MEKTRDFFGSIDDADIHFVWLMLFAAEHGAWIGGMVGATLLVVAVTVMGQLLGLMGIIPVAAGILGAAAAVFVPHGCYVLAVLFGVACILVLYTKKKNTLNIDNENLLESAVTTGIDLSEDCPPKFCF